VKDSWTGSKSTFPTTFKLTRIHKCRVLTLFTSRLSRRVDEKYLKIRKNGAKGYPTRCLCYVRKSCFAFKLDLILLEISTSQLPHSFQRGSYILIKLVYFSGRNFQNWFFWRAAQDVTSVVKRVKLWEKLVEHQTTLFTS